MKIYGKKNVFEAALDRIRWLYKEFPNVIVSVSGGKDSTVVFHLTLQVARELGRLPLKVLFIDQEAEWQATVDQVRLMMTHPDVQPMWLQMPIRLFNATSAIDHWLFCWDERERHRWMREKEPYAWTENRYGTDRFKDLFPAFLNYEYPATPTANISGVRCEESPGRSVGLTTYPTYKWVTWGNKIAGGRHYTFYPIYDWGYTDVWAAIARNGWPYNRIYDIQYRHGIQVSDMRVSNVHHETAVVHLFYMQEAEPATYAKLTQRISGVDAAGKLGVDYFVKDLPYMFRDWGEYRDFLLDKLIENKDWRRRFRERFAREEKKWGHHKELATRMRKTHVGALLTNDFEFTKMENFRNLSRFLLRKAGKLSWKAGSRGFDKAMTIE